MSNHSGGQVFLAFLGGAAVGALVGLLTAPSSGEELRERVVTTARRRRNEIARIPTAVRAAYTEAAEAARNAFIEAYNAQTDPVTGKVAAGGPPARSTSE